MWCDIEGAKERESGLCGRGGVGDKGERWATE